MCMQTFFKYGVRIYLTTLIVATLIFVLNIIYGSFNPYLMILSVCLFYLAGNMKFAHGILFNEGVLKRYNQFLCVIFNVLCLGFLCYYFGFLFGIIES